MKALDKKEKAAIAKLNKQVKGGYVMKLTKVAIPAYKEMAKVFNGQLDMEKFPREKLEKVSAKLTKVNKKLRSRVENAYKKKGIKPHKLSERVKLRQKKFERQLGEKNMDLIRSGKFKLQFGALVEGKLNNSNYDYSSSTDSIASNSPKRKDKETNKKEEKVSSKAKQEKKQLEKEKRFNEAELARARNKKYKVNTIRNKPNENIFKFISQAYIKSMGKLDQDTIKGHKMSDEFRLIKKREQELLLDATKQSLLLPY